LAKKLQEYHQQNTVTPEEYYYLLANPNVIPLLLDFCTQFPTPPSDGTIQGAAQGEPYDPYQDESNLCNFFRNIVFKCQLDAPQAKWLANSTPDVMQMHAFLNEHQWDAASKQTVQWYTNANAKGTFPNFVEDDDLFPITLVYDYALNYVVYRKECQDDNNGEPCSNLWVCLEAMHRTIGGYVHVGLDICGFFLEPCDAANGVFYTLEGDFLNASISYISAIPVAGWFSIGGKYAGLFFKTADGVAHSLPYTRTAGNVFNFGNRNKLRSVLHIAEGSTNEAHHIIPWEHSGPPLTQLAADGKFHMNHSKNGIELPRFRADPGTDTHANHPQYNLKVEAKMNQLWDQLTDYYGANSVPSSVAKEKLIELEESIRNHIIQNPTVKINDLTLNGVNVPNVP
jgi:hypothetical protein